MLRYPDPKMLLLALHQKKITGENHATENQQESGPERKGCPGYMSRHMSG